MRIKHGNQRFSIQRKYLVSDSVAYGCTNEWKMEQAAKYREAGVNTSFYMLRVEPRAYTDTEKNMLKFALDHKINVQLLPMDFSSRKLAEKIAGVQWEVLKKSYGTHKNKEELFEHKSDLVKTMQGTYYSRGNGDIAPEVLSEETKSLVGNNKGHVRLCYYNSKEEDCGSCFLRQGKIADVKEKEITYRRKNALLNMRTMGRKNRGQITMNFGETLKKNKSGC